MGHGDGGWADAHGSGIGLATWPREDGLVHVVFRLEGRELTAETCRLQPAAASDTNLQNYFGTVRLEREER
jgi:hypothetical protein